MSKKRPVTISRGTSKRRRISTQPPIREFPDRGLKWILDPQNVLGLLLSLSKPIAERIDVSRMERLPSSFISHNLRKQEADIIYRAPYRTGEGEEQEVWIYVLIENQSSPDPSIGFRLLFYMVEIWQSQRKEWLRQKKPINEWRFLPIIPVVLYTGDETWSSQPGLELLMDLPEELRCFVPQFETLMLRLKQSDPSELTAPGHPFGWLLRIIQKEHAPAEELEAVINEAIEQIETLAEEDREAWQRLIQYILLLLLHRRSATEGKAISGRIWERVRSQGRGEGREMEQTWAQSLIAEGMTKGIEKGREEGIEKGIEQGREEGIEKGRIDAAQRMLLRQLRARFGPLPEAAEIRVRAIREEEKLDDLGVQLLGATSLEELGL